MHGHPGSCIRDTRGALRLLVDADLSCRDSKHAIAVPYVISQPSWLVAAELPDGHAAARSTLLFFRGHLPRPTIDTRNVRRVLLTSRWHQLRQTRAVHGCLCGSLCAALVRCLVAVGC